MSAPRRDIPSLDGPSDGPRWSWLPQPLATVIIAITWLLLVDSVAPGQILLGLIFGFAIPLFTSRFLPVAARVHRWGALLAFLPIFLWDLFVANLTVALLILRVGYTPRSRWLAIPLDLVDPFGITALAAVISLTPGTVSSRLSEDRTVLWVHALDVADPAAAVKDIKDRYERPMQRIFEA
jgi:multicomponent K+:H+ antiporter subunit E